MLIGGLALFAISIVLIWLCLPGKGGEAKPLLRSDIAGVIAAVVVTGCLAVGIVLTIAGFAS